MKATVSNKELVRGFDKLCEVATKGVKSDFQLAGRITIEVLSDKLVLWSTNGHLDARYTISDVSDCEPGIITVDAVIGRDVIRVASQEGKDILMSVDKDVLHLKAGRKKFKISTLPKNHVGDDAPDPIKIVIPAKTPKNGLKYTFPQSMLSDGISTVARYKAPLKYKTEYLQICMHFLEDKVRFVCGDGMRFAVYARNHEKNGITGDGGKWLLPSDQAMIIAAIIDEEVSLTYSDAKTCYIQCGKLDMLLKGIPEIEYISYDVHAYRFEDAVALVDINYDDMSAGMETVRVVRDKEMENEGDFHSCTFDAAPNTINFAVNEGRYQADFDADISFTKIKVDKFKSIYSYAFLNEVTHAITCEALRFYCIEEGGIMLAEPFVKDADSKGDGVRAGISQNANAPTGEPLLIFFFAAATEDEEE
jgi:DNA polymerase III sliding clamp (beta) subunit (PCNA family)